MPLERVDQDRLTDAVRRYRNMSGRLMWNKRELPKFYFAGLLSSRVNLIIDPPAKILEQFRMIQSENFYFQSSDSPVAGIQFLRNVGDERFDDEMTLADVELMKQLAITTDIRKCDFDKRTVHFTTLSSWMGTLRPNEFMPISSTLHRHANAYLFNLETSIYDSDDVEFFIRAQRLGFILKKALRRFDFTDFYLRDITEFLKFKHPKLPLRKDYHEREWNWLIQDFQLFVFEEILGFREFCEVDDEELELAVRAPGFVPQFAGMPHAHSYANLPA